MSMTGLSLRRPVTTIMVYLGILLLGVIAWTRLPRELFPPITYPQLTVVTHYRDAAPEEIEVLVTKQIEEVVGTVSGLRRISSISKEELSLVIAEFNWDTNMDFAGLGVREKIDLIKERLPRGSEEPVVIRYNPFELPVMVLNLSGEAHPHRLLTIARKQVKNELEKIEGVAAVNLSGGLEREILVEVDQGRLQASGLPISHVVDSLSRANLNYPAGTIKEAFYEYLIRTMGEFSLVREIPKIAVGVDEEKKDPAEELQERQRQREGRPLRREKGVGPEQRLILLRDVAVVKDTYKERESISRFNGRDNISLKIQRQAGANTLQLAQKVKEAMREIRRSLPPGMTLMVAYDQSSAIQESIQGVLSAAMQGGLFAFIVLYLFVGSLWAAVNVALAIPISILGTIGLMYFSGLTINVISMGGLALGIGMLVDAGIVVVENIAVVRARERDAAAAAEGGTHEVASAIAGTVLTTIVVFLPMVFVVGIAGQLFKELAYTVTFSLLMSLAVSLTLTPLFASRQRGGAAGGAAAAGWIEPILELLRRMDVGLVRWFIGNRALGLLLMAGLFGVSLFWMRALDRELLPRVDQGQFILKVNLLPGTKLEVTDQVSGRIEQVLQAMPEVREVTVTIGSSKERKEKRAEELLEALEAHQAQILVNLAPRVRGVGSRAGPGYRTRRSSEIVQELKETLAREPLEGAEIEYVLQESVFKSAFLAGTPVVVEVKGTDLGRLERLADQVKKELERVPGLYGVQNSLIPPSPETKVNVIKDRAATYHLSVSDIALTAQTALKGFMATKFKEGGEEFDIRVRLRKEDRTDMNKVRRLLLHSPLDVDIPLAEVAYFAIGKGPTEIRRLDQQRTVTVAAQLYQRPLGQTLDEVASVLQRMKVPAGYTVALTGENEQMQESFQSLAFALLLSVILVYMVMASEFESLWQPFLIMGTIPLSLIGVVFALAVTSTPISIMVALGFIILGGVVVDNGIVLIEYVNLLRRRGMGLEEAVIEASGTRLRPILMTAATTVLALVPLALGLQEGVELQAPMGITVIGGLTASTFLTLIFLPTLYVAGAHFFEGFRRRPAPPLPPPSGPFGGGEPPPPEPPVSPAQVEEIRPPQPVPEHLPEPVAEVLQARVAVPEIPEDFGGEEAVPEGSGMALLPAEEFLSRPEPAAAELQAPAEPQAPPPPPVWMPPPLPAVAPPAMPPVAPAPSVEPQAEPTAPLNPRQQKLVDHLKAHGRITRKEYVELTGASVPTAARDLKELVDRGWVKGIGPLAKGRYYVLA